MPLTLYKRNGIYHCRGTIGPDGRRQSIRRSLHTGNKDIAARQIAEIEANYWKGHFDGPGAILTFDQAAALFKAAGRSTRFLEPIETYFKGVLIKDIKPGTIRQMANELYGHCSGASRNRLAISPAQSVINHAADSELCDPIRVKRFPVETKEKEPATLAWVKSFQAEAAPHLGAYALFMFLTGARPSEALAIDPDRDLNLHAATVVIRETKVSTERRAHLPSLLVATLANLPRIPGRPLFVYRHYDDMKWSWDSIAGKTGLRLTPHCCRHGFATELLRRGVDVVTVAWLGGWASAEQVLKTYGHAIKKRDLTNV